MNVCLFSFNLPLVLGCINVYFLCLDNCIRYQLIVPTVIYISGWIFSVVYLLRDFRGAKANGVSLVFLVSFLKLTANL